MSSQERRNRDIRTSDELIRIALKGSGEGDSDKALWELRARGTKDVYQKAKKLTSSSVARKRKLGVEILCQLGTPERAFRDESISTLLTLLQHERNKDVVCAIGWGLGHLRATEGVEHLVKRMKDPEAEIRLAVVGGLLCQESDLAIDALIALSTDEDDEVRSWATCALGTLIDLDDHRIREALFARLSDSHEETQQEALYGLAKRRDERVIDILSDWLRSYPGFSFDLRAAYDLGSPSLLPTLVQLRSCPSVDSDLLEKAITSCSQNSS